MTLHLHNSLTRRVEEFKPLNPTHVGLYLCGPTVYARAHVGNFRSGVVFDVLYRLLKKTYQVTYVRNITDIDDKIIKAAQELNISIDVLTAETTRFYQQDSAALNILPPTFEPRATDHVDDMIALIQVLLAKGMAYEAHHHVLFQVSRLSSYGALSNTRLADMIAGARVEVAAYKKDPADFVLWKPSDDTQPGWDSPWGRGRPGWHIECSAMTLKHLGVSFDIHAGGQDLIFPHHENEIAQSQGAHGADTFARYWLHNGILTVNGEKMSKSLGNFITLETLLQKARGETIRFALLSTHYRQALDFTAETLPQARAALNRLYGALEGMPATQDALAQAADAQVAAALEDDLNIPLAIARLHGIAGEIYKSTPSPARAALQQTLLASAEVLGILQQDPQTWLQGQEAGTSELSADEIEDWIQKRLAARHAKDFAEADRIRDMLQDAGIAVLDSSSGTTWRRG